MKEIIKPENVIEEMKITDNYNVCDICTARKMMQYRNRKPDKYMSSIMEHSFLLFSNHSNNCRTLSPPYFIGTQMHFPSQ